VEYDGLEMSGHFRRRGKRQEQQIALIRKLWEQPVVDHEDSDHRIDRAGILPRPKRRIPTKFHCSIEFYQNALSSALETFIYFLFGCSIDVDVPA
jgi:hypothetical protein